MNDASKHPVGPDPASELASDHSPIDPRDFRTALGSYATGVTIITVAGGDGKPYGITCNSFASVSLNPPLVLWSLVLYSSSLSAFQDASHFAVNVLGISQQALANKFAKSSDDKFVGVEWARGKHGLPVLGEGTVAHAECELYQVVNAGDHAIVIGLILDGEHKLDISPLMYFRRAYSGFPVD